MRPLRFTEERLSEHHGDVGEAGLEAAIAGRPVSGIDAAAQAVIEKAGLADHINHRTGHGMGILCHEFQNIAYNHRPLRENEVYSVEPGIYVHGLGGFPQDDTVAIGSTPEILTKSAKDLKSQTILYTIIKNYMRDRDRRCQEMFVPLAHPAGHGQADFGEAVVVIDDVEQRAHFFVLDRPYSDAYYVRAYPAAVAEAWVDGAMSRPSPSSVLCRSRSSAITCPGT